MSTIDTIERRLDKAMAQIKARNDKPLVINVKLSEVESLTNDEILIARGIDPNDPLLPSLIIKVVDVFA